VTCDAGSSFGAGTAHLLQRASSSFYGGQEYSVTATPLPSSAEPVGILIRAPMQ
jgi:hypothetical protein